MSQSNYNWDANSGLPTFFACVHRPDLRFNTFPSISVKRNCECGCNCDCLSSCVRLPRGFNNKRILRCNACVLITHCVISQNRFSNFDPKFRQACQKDPMQRDANDINIIYNTLCTVGVQLLK